MAFAYLAATRMPLPIALYLALTGTRITEPSDLIATGLATHYVPSESLEALRKSLLSQEFDPNNVSAQLAECVAAHAVDPPEVSDSQGIAASKDLIDRAIQPALDAMESGKGSVVAVKDILKGLDAMVCNVVLRVALHVLLKSLLQRNR